MARSMDSRSFISKTSVFARPASSASRSGGPQLDNKARIGRIKSFASGSNSVVECDLAKVEVAGSNPVSRSRFQFHPSPLAGVLFIALQ
jgi:hypothetical protein